MYIQILPREEQILQFGACGNKTDLRILVVFDNAVCRTVYGSGIVPIAQRSRGMNLFNAMIPVKPEPVQELQDLFRLFFFELAVCLATVFGGRIRPFADLIHIHGGQYGNHLCEFAVAAGYLHGDHATGGIPFVHLFVIPYILIAVQVYIMVLIGATVFFHHQIEREYPVTVFQ